MDTKEFLQKVLPSEGLGAYCLLGIKNKKVDPIAFFDTIDALIVEAEIIDEKKINAFMAMGVFKDTARLAENCTHMRSLFLDLDVGDSEKVLPSKEEALTQLISFLEKTKLPRPMLVDSGRGFHCYWSFEKDIPKEEWLSVARKFKALCIFHEFKIDTNVPADAARVLRVVGTHNHKGEEPLPVTVLRDAPVREWEKIKALVEDAYTEHIGIDLSSARRELDEDTKALLKLDNFDSSFKKIVRRSLSGEGCAQIEEIVTQQANCPEPLWRAGLSVAIRCEDGEKAIHIMSEEHPDYDYQTTIKKAYETKGPYTCSTFSDLNPQGCKNCPHKGKITSPIQLGKVVAKLRSKPAEEVIEVQVEVQVEENVAAPRPPASHTAINFPQFLMPFERGPNGGICYTPPPEYDRKTKKYIERDPVVLYENDLYVVKRIFDPLEGESVVMRVELPMDGGRDFLMPLKYVNAVDKFREITSANGVAIYKKNLEALMDYTTKWVKYLQNQSKADAVYMQMGWNNDSKVFVLGDKEYRKEGVFESPPSNVTKEVAKFLRKEGDFLKWKETFNVFDNPGFELHAFGAFVGFGTPLLKFTKHDGCIVNLRNSSPGTGKTVSLLFCNSIWGHPKELLIGDSTYNAKYQRLGVMQNLPMTIDEISNIEPKDMSMWAYYMTAGKGKIRQSASANVERANYTTWSTMSLTSSNPSIYEILSRNKAAAAGEMVRVLEFEITRPDGLNAGNAPEMFNGIHDNYGHAGPIYAQWLVNQTEESIRERVERWRQRVLADFGTDSDKRFWISITAVVFAGAEAAQELGLHDIDISRVYRVTINEIKNAEARSMAERATAEDVLANFINLNVSNLLKIRNTKDESGLGNKLPTVTPKGRLVIRYEPDTKFLYVNRKDLRDYCNEIKYGIDVLEKELTAQSVLVDPNCRKRMSAGWEGGVDGSLAWTYKLHYPDLDIPDEPQEQ